MVDSGCTSHIGKDRQKFESFDKTFDPRNHSIELADGQQQQGTVQGIDNALNTIQDRDGNAQNVILKNALYIPGFKQDIMSV